MISFEGSGPTELIVATEERVSSFLLQSILGHFSLAHVGGDCSDGHTLFQHAAWFLNYLFKVWNSLLQANK